MSEVFISYRHENDHHCARVRKFAEQLEADGVTVILDAFAEQREFHGGAPPRGWAHWSNHQASTAPTVIAIASSGWFRVFHTSEPLETGKGAAAEAGTVHDRLYHLSGFNNFLCIGYFDEQHDLTDLPVVLHKCGRFDLADESKRMSLVQWLRRPLSAPPKVVTDKPSEREPSFSPVAISRPDETRVPLQLPPAAVAKFYGRVKESHQLEQRLRERLGTAVVGPAGYGKTALAAEAVLAVVGSTAESLAASPYPDGVVFLDLYAYRGQAEPVWHELTNALSGPGFLQTSPAHQRATQACRERRVLVIIEGGEEADGKEGRVAIGELLSVLSLENRCLLLTREIKQAHPHAMIRLDEPLGDKDAGRLFDALTGKRVTGAARERILALLAGHPLGLTWAGGLLARDDEDPSKLADDWQSDPTRLLGDTIQAEHTLEWLFGRSVQGLDETAQQALAAAGLLARAPFPIAAIEAGVADAASVGTPVRVASDAGSIGHVREALKQLIDRGLLRRTGEDEQREFTHVLGYRFARNESASDAGLRNGLGGWLHQRLSAFLTVGANSTDGLADLLQHAAALLRTDHDQQLWHTLAYFLLYKGQGRLVSLGRLDWVNAALGAVDDWLDRFPAEKAAEPFWQRERSVCFNKLGDLATEQGNLPEAQRLFGEDLRIAQRLAESDPADAEWQRDLSVSFNKLGELATAQGNLPEAQRLFGECHRTLQHLAESDPVNTAWQRDLSVSFGKLGELATAQGNLPEAQRLFGESLRIAQRLAESDPANAAWQRDLSYSLTFIAQLLMRQDRWTEALLLLEQSLAIDERLATLAPTNVMFQDDVAVSWRLVAQVRAKALNP